MYNYVDDRKKKQQVPVVTAFMLYINLNYEFHFQFFNTIISAAISIDIDLLTDTQPQKSYTIK